MRHRSAPRVRALALTIGVCAALGATACGSADATHARLAGDPTSTPLEGPPLTSAECAPAVAATLGSIAQRIYHEAANGSIAGEAVNRVEHSTALAKAISSANATATRVVLNGLLAGQIVRIEVLRSGRVFASAGSGAAIAPVEGSIPGSGGARFILSVQADSAYLQVTRQVTGAEVLLRAGVHPLGATIRLTASSVLPASGQTSINGQSYQALSLPGSVYPSGALQIELLVPIERLSCPGSAAQTRVETLGRVGEEIYREELESPYVKATVRHMEATAAFRAAVAAHNFAATRAAIIGFFAAHIHVVRVRVTVGSRLLIDLGGPHVLAPVHGVLHQGAKVIGEFTMAIQDDAGYLRLAHLFTGAEILMRTSAGQVEGTLKPGPATVPARGPVTYHGRSYEAYSFSGEAFPSGPLRISLLIGS